MTTSLARLKGKAAIVTGGGSGIGRAVCQVFATEGACVAIVDINKKGAEETLTLLPSEEGQIHCVIQADVSNPGDVKNVFATAEQKFGKKCSILVNCAGIAIGGSYFSTLPMKDLDDNMSVNFKGTYLMSKEFVLSLKDVDAEVRGSLINISSISARTAIPKYTEYASSKAATVTLTKNIAVEFPQHRIRANVLLPGATDTPLFAMGDKEVVEAVKKNIPMGRIGQPVEIANVCLFLASDESSYVNGASINLDGGTP